MPEDRKREVSADEEDLREQDEQDVADLPERDALSLLPSSLIGGLGDGTTSLGGSLLGGSSTPPADPSQVPAEPSSGTIAPTPQIQVPHLPVPTDNPDGTYNPDTTATNKT
jgi:hypothetical protein